MPTDLTPPVLPGEEEHWPTDLAFEVVIWWSATEYVKGLAISHQNDITDEADGRFVRAFEEGITIPSRLLREGSTPVKVEKGGVEYGVLRIEVVPDDVFPRFNARTIFLRRDLPGRAA